MRNNSPSFNRPPRRNIHPLVYKLLIVLAIWTVLASWGFALGGTIELVLAVVSLFVLIAVSLTSVLWRISRRNRDHGLDGHEDEGLGDWLGDQVDTWSGSLKGSQAAAQIILPLAAAAVGMTLLVVVLHLDLFA